MEIFKYIDYFHDGSIFDIQDDGKAIRFLVESAEVEKEVFEKSFPLSRENTIQGLLHMEEIEEVRMDNQIAKRPLKMKNASEEILNLEIEGKEVFLLIQWVSYLIPKDIRQVVTKIEIKARKIYWKNVQFPEENRDQLLDIKGNCMEIKETHSHVDPPFSE